MPIFEVQDSMTGITFDIEGDTEPTEAEAAELIQSTPEFAQWTANQAANSQEAKRQFNSTIPEDSTLAGTALEIAKPLGTRKEGFTGAIAQGALDTILAGTPEAAAALANVPLEGNEATQIQHPYAYAAGQTAGAFLPLGRLAQAARGGGRALMREGARLGGVMGFGAGASNVIEQGERDPVEVVKEGTVTGLGGAALGAGLGAGAAYLARPRTLPRDQGVIAEKKTLEALKTGVEASDKRIPGVDDATVSNPEASVQRANPLIFNENPNPQSMDDYRDAADEGATRVWRNIDRRLTTQERQGMVLPGEDVARETFKGSVFNADYLERLSSVEMDQLNAQIDAMSRFRNRHFEGAPQLDGLARSIMNHRNFASLSQEARDVLINRINSVERTGPGISGDELFVSGLRELYPIDLSVNADQVLQAARGADRYRGKDLSPWEAQDRLKEINKALRKYESLKPDDKAVKSTMTEIEALNAEARVLRNQLNDRMSRVRDEFREWKLDWGALNQVSEMARAAGLNEKINPQVTGFRRAIKGAGVRNNSAIGLVDLISRIGRTPDNELYPSERIVQAGRAFGLSQAVPPRLLGRQGAGALTGLVRSSPLTRSAIQAGVAEREREQE